jgi:hypothetical protein
VGSRWFNLAEARRWPATAIRRILRFLAVHWFNLAVVGLWLATMTWLVVEKFLPPLLVGEPPSLVDRRNEPLGGWRLSFNDRPIGWALSAAVRLPKELTEVRSRVHFDEVPLAEFGQGPIAKLVALTQYGRAKMQMDSTSTLLIDPLGRLSRFDSSVRLEGVKESLRMEGTAEDGDMLKLSVRSGEVTFYEGTTPISHDAILGDSLSPQTRLSGLRKDQTWTVPTLNPLSLGNMGGPPEVLRATVDGMEPVVWNGQAIQAWLVVFRNDPGIGLGIGKKPCGRLWVRPDGMVLKQEVIVLSSRMTFVRLSEDAAAALAKKVGFESSPIVPRETSSSP